MRKIINNYEINHNLLNLKPNKLNKNQFNNLILNYFDLIHKIFYIHKYSNTLKLYALNHV